MFDLLKQEETSIIKVIGVGGGGSNAVTHMYKQGIAGVDFAICNTDIQAMRLSPVPTKIQLGETVSAGLGAGSQPQRGKQACLESIEGVRKYLEHGGTKMLFVTAGMGGGTGTGAAPIIAKQAQELNILTVGIVTLPFSFEGKKRILQAHEGLEELKKNVDTLIIISNDKLKSIYSNLTISSAFAHADNVLTTAAKGIAEIITIPGYVNVDFEDVNTVMRNSGVAIMGTGVADGDNRAQKAIDMAMSSPLLEDNNIQGAQHILVNITSGTKEVTMEEVTVITNFVQEEAGASSNLIWGNCFDDTLGDKLAVTVIATGFDRANQPTPEKAPNSARVVVSLDDKPHSDRKGNFLEGFDVNTEGAANIVELTPSRNSKPSQQPQVNLRPEPLKTQEEIEREEEEKRRQALAIAQAKEKFRSELQTVKLTNPQTVIELENEPAYLRRKVALDNIKVASNKTAPRWNLDENDNIRQGNSNNSYLHDNVD